MSTEKILNIFEQINQIPRESKNEEAIAAWLVNWAKERKLEVKTDKLSNILIKIPATAGYENAPVITLQGHMDMVCQKTPESKHDFAKDPIEHIYDGEWLKANQTTLGADNGIALAMALYLAETTDKEHPALELLFTVDEETGLTGATNLEEGFVEGKVLLNLDSEDEGVFTIGCAGGKQTDIELELDEQKLPESFDSWEVAISGIMGGHSGVDINLPRANAIKVLSRILAILTKSAKINLANLDGGTAHNAIARDAAAIIICDPKDSAKLQQLVADFDSAVKNEYASEEKSIQVKLNKRELEKNSVFSDKATIKAINLMLAMPHGVAAMSADIEGLVETSNNFALLRTKENTIQIQSNQRSSVASRLEAITSKIEAVAQLAGAEFTTDAGYPGWEPNVDSPLLKKCQDVYQRIFDKEPLVEAIHAGLECGLIGDKCPGMDMISFGPTIKNPHSPDEKLHLPSIEKIWVFLLELLKEYKK